MSRLLQRLRESLRFADGMACNARKLTAQRTHRIMPLLDAFVEPSLNGRVAKTHQLACDRVAPLLGGELLELRPQLAFWRR